MLCPCRKKSEARGYADCCGPYHAGAAVPRTAEALMRSRYSAFALRKAAYVLGTWHVSTRPPAIEFDPAQEWMLLWVIAAHTEGECATVEFVARSRTGGRTDALHEISRFVRENGRWWYVDGVLKS
jgi:SEC-C motif-containing protein